jgi:hypothetical protein
MTGAADTPDEPDRTFSQDEVNQIVAKRLAREREAQTRVTHEPRTYAKHSQHSYYSDVVAAAWSDAPDQARSRLTRYERELGAEMVRGSKEGRRAERIIRARGRTADAAEGEQRTTKLLNEIRGFGTDGGVSASSPGEAASFVSPAFLLDEWVPYRGAARSFADQCMLLPLPGFGLKVYVPAFTAGPTVGEQTEGGSVSETEPTTGLESSGTVETITGQITGTQQLHDRGGSGGGATDIIIGKQLQQQLDASVDLYALNRAIEKGTAVSGESTYSTEGLYKDLAKGRKEITDTAGTRLRPTSIFTTSDIFSHATSQLDEQHRPILVPTFVPGFPLAADADDHDESNKLPKWSRFTGVVMPGSTLWFTDDNIPLVGTTTQTQILVSSPGDAILLMEDEPVLSVFLETKGDKLQTVLNLREYAACATRHSAGTSVIAGAGYTSALK